MIKTAKEKLRQLLAWSEKHIKTDMTYVAKGGSWLALGNIVSSGASFLLSVAFANLFPKESYGIYRYVFSVIGVTSALALTGMDAALTQAVARGFDGTLQKSFRDTFLWTVGTSIMVSGIGIYYFLSGNHTLGWGLIIAAISTPLIKSANLFNGFLAGKKDFSRKTRYGLFYDLFPVALLIVTLFFTDSVLVMLCVYFISYMFVAVVLYMLTLRVYTPKGPYDPTARQYSIHMSAMNILGTISFQIDKIIMFHYFGAAQLAVYSFSLVIPQQLKQVQKLLGTLVFPKFSEWNMAVIKQNIWRKSAWVFLIMFLVVICYVVAAPFIFTTFFPQYIDSTTYSQFYALTLLLTPAIFFKQALYAHKQVKNLYFIQVFPPLLKIVLLLIIIPQFGILGAVLTLVFIDIVGFITTVIGFHHAAASLGSSRL